MRFVSKKTFEERDPEELGSSFKVSELGSTRIVIQNRAERNQVRGTTFDFASLINSVEVPFSFNALCDLKQTASDNFARLINGKIDYLEFNHVSNLCWDSILSFFNANVKVDDYYIIWSGDDIGKIAIMVDCWFNNRLDNLKAANSPVLAMYVWEPEHHGQNHVAVVAASEKEAKEAADAFVEEATKTDGYAYDDWQYPQYYTLKVYAPGQVAVFSND